MEANKVMVTTEMILRVDLGCCKCFKKVKKVLAKFPQIRDQVYDFKANTVRIVVICCSPEKFRDKLCRKGGGSIKSIEIPQPPRPPTPKKKEAQTQTSPPRGPCCNCCNWPGWGPCFNCRPPPFPPPPPPPCFCRPVCHCWCPFCGRFRWCMSSGHCFSDENPNGCSIM